MTLLLLLYGRPRFTPRLSRYTGNLPAILGRKEGPLAAHLLTCECCVGNSPSNVGRSISVTRGGPSLLLRRVACGVAGGGGGGCSTGRGLLAPRALLYKAAG